MKRQRIDVWAIKKEYDHLVVNIHHPNAQWDVLVDRTTDFGNPYRLNIDMPKNRELVCVRFHAHLQNLIRSGEMPMERLADLAGNRLGCHCAPKLCHAHIIAWAAHRCDRYLLKRGG